MPADKPGGPVESIHDRLVLTTAKRHDKCRRIAQIRADGDFRHRHRLFLHFRIIDYITLQQLRQGLTDQFPNAQLPL